MPPLPLPPRHTETIGPFTPTPFISHGIKAGSPATDDPRSVFTTCACGGGWTACGGGWTACGGGWTACGGGGCAPACGAGPDHVQERMGDVGYTDCTLQSQRHHKLSHTYVPTHNIHRYVMNIKDSFPSLSRIPPLVDRVSSDYTLLKMRCDDCTNHRLLQGCNWSQRLLGATVTLNCHFCSYALMCDHLSCVVKMPILGNKSAILDNCTYRDDCRAFVR